MHLDHPLVALGGALAIGFYLTVIARRTNIPTIVLLLAGGVVFGPELLNLVRPEQLGEMLPVVVQLSVGLILFEGGLTLNIKEYFASSREIRRILTLGVLVTWLGTAALLYFLLDLPVNHSLLAASLVIVTGPTVIMPILRRIRIEPRVHNILHWEGVLIDAIGVFIAILCFEWVVVGAREQAVLNFGIRIAAGLIIGILGGILLCKTIRTRIIPEKSINGFALATAVLVFTLTEAVIEEAGLLAVTVAGLYSGWNQPARLKDIKRFKEEITDVLIGMLFMLLAARLDLDQFLTFGWHGVLVVTCVMLLIRPSAIAVSTWGSDLKLNQKLFLSWVAPRGIVAASMASLFSIGLQQRGLDLGESRFLETFTYSVICATVIIQGFSAGLVARLLGLRQPEPDGWLIVGAHRFGRELARHFGEKTGATTIIMDTNIRNIQQAENDGLTALRGDAMETDEWADKLGQRGIGYMLALTDNAELNALLCQRWKESLSEEHVFGWQPRESSAASAQAEEGHGPGIWGHLPRPSVVSGEIQRGEALLTVREAGANKATRALPLARFSGKKVLPDGEGAETNELSQIVLLRKGGFLRRALEKGKLLTLRAEDKQDLYKKMVAVAVECEPRLSVDRMLEELATEEKILPPYLGHGVSVPHVYSANIDARLCILIHLSDEGLKLEGQDEPLKLVFFIISPAGDPEGHLATLAEVARACGDPGFRAIAEREDCTIRELFTERQ